MPSHLHDFMFDVNFGLGSESVFCPIENIEGMAPPPIEGYLLLTDNTPFLLTDLEPMALA